MAKKEKPSKKAKPPIVDDSYLWDHVTKDIEPLHAKNTTEKATIESTQKASPAIEHQWLQRSSSLRSKMPEHKIEQGDARDVNRAMAKQVKAGKYPVDERLDLHGKTQEQAHLALQNAIENAYHTGKRCLLVITGKGKFSDGGGILRKQLPFWLNQSNLRPYILMVQQATQKDGGSGAFYVMIKRKR